MNYSIDKSKKEAAYLQLYKKLRSDIIKGVYPYGDKLPSKRTLSDEAMTSVITVKHAYEILCDEGYIEARERSGYYVLYRKSDFTPLREQAPLMPPSPPPSATNETFPFSVFAKTMRNVLSKYKEQILIKSPGFGSLLLREAISDYLARAKGIRVTAKQIVIGSGAEYLYGLIVQFLGRDKRYALEDPSYEKIRSVYQANGASCDFLKLGGDGILTRELQKTEATVLHVTPFRSFPSGVTASASKRMEYITWATERNGIIIEDDFDSEFTVSTKNEDTLFSLEPLRHVLYVNTFTKTIAPSMRIGYMVLPKELVTPFSEKFGFYSCTVPMLEQYVLLELLNNGDFERHINRIRRRRRQAQKEKPQKA